MDFVAEVFVVVIVDAQQADPALCFRLREQLAQPAFVVGVERRALGVPSGYRQIDQHHARPVRGNLSHQLA